MISQKKRPPGWWCLAGEKEETIRLLSCQTALLKGTPADVNALETWLVVECNRGRITIRDTALLLVDFLAVSPAERGTYKSPKSALDLTDLL